MRETNSKNTKNWPKNYIFVAEKGWNWAKKLRVPKANLGRVLNVHGLISNSQLNWKESYARNELKKWKRRPKKPIFGTVRGWKGTEKSRLQKGVTKAPTKCRYIPNFKFTAQFDGEKEEEQVFYKVKILIFEAHYNHENWKKASRSDVVSLTPNVGKKSSIGVKIRDPQKANLGPLLNVHPQFQLTSSNLKVSYARDKYKK